MQTRWVSLVEMITGKVIGFAVAVVAQLIVLPLFYDGVQIGVTQNMKVALIFTAVASVKTYGVRRLFNWLEVRWFHRQEEVL